MHRSFGKQLRKGPQMEHVLEGRKRSAPVNKGKQCKEEGSQRKKEGRCDKEMVGSRTSHP